ncbi:hypothetical protein BBK36DRAFT_148737, partial [Trichoderma citrinoviride]
MDRQPSHDVLNNSAHDKILDPPGNDTKSAASQSASSSAPSNTTVGNVLGDISHQESRPPYHPPSSQANHQLDDKQAQGTRQGPADTPNGERHGDAHGDTITSPLNPSQKPQAQPAESRPSQPTPSERAARPMSISSLLTHPNGVYMFPELSASEQDALSREALAEAEESIVADIPESVHGGPDDSASDAGYDSDSVSSASTSAMSSVRDYMYENGRRYHRFREGSYNFPNDDVEQE